MYSNISPEFPFESKYIEVQGSNIVTIQRKKQKEVKKDLTGVF
jgi:hypothetical protein